MSASRSDHLALGYSSHSASQNRSNSPSATNSPIDPLSAPTRSVFGLAGGMNSSSIIASNTRSGAGSPSHEMAASSRLYSKRFVALQELRLPNPISIRKNSMWLKRVASNCNKWLILNFFFLGPARFKLKKVFLASLSTLGAGHRQVGTRLLSEKTSPSLPPTAFQTLFSYLRPRLCLPPDGLELVPYPRDSPVALATIC